MQESSISFAFPLTIPRFWMEKTNQRLQQNKKKVMQLHQIIMVGENFTQQETSLRYCNPQQQKAVKEGRIEKPG